MRNPAPVTLADAFTQLVAPVDVVLRDGTTARLRSADNTDREGLRTLFAQLSDESRYFRFLRATGRSDRSCELIADIDYPRNVSLVAERGHTLLGVATCARERADDARGEVAFVVAEGFHGHGLATRMLERLAEIARPLGVDQFEAWVHVSNGEMLAVFRDSGFTVAHHDQEVGVSRLVLDLHETPAFLHRAASRASAAAVASLEAFFRPGVVAVVGASRSRGKIGAEIFHAITAGGFTGTVIPVNPAGGAIGAVRAVPRVTAIEGPVDLGIIAVPAGQVEAVVDDCIEKGVKAIVIVTAGFSERDAAGRASEVRIVEKVRDAGIRLIGPNCMGLVQTDPAVSLNASFAPSMPPRGRVAFLSQSGALGLAILENARRLQLGISTFVSVGNKADVSGNDLVQYWAEDAGTDVILLYLESFGNPRNFARIARRVARTKPIVAVKAGRSTAGARAASSHTGAMATDDRVVDALFEQAGIIRTATLEELFDVATLLAHQPLPRGPRVAVLTNAGGPGILAADACAADGLEVATLTEASMRALQDAAPHAASVANPVDLLASATADDYRRALAVLLEDPHVDAVQVLYVPVLTDRAAEIAAVLAAAARQGREGEKPILATFLDATGADARVAGIPTYAFPEAGARALARVHRYARWRRAPEGRPANPSNVDIGAARTVIETAMRRGGGWLDATELDRLLDAMGLPVLRSLVARTEAQARAAASVIGFPVAMKAIGRDIVHKTDIGGVKLSLNNEPAVAGAWQDMASRLGARLEGVLIQEMAADAPEMLIGAVQHPIFGPLVACGAGGTLAELVQDTAYRLTPLTEDDAREMVDGLKAAHLLRGYRGAPPADEAALRDVLLRLSVLLESCPSVLEVDLNPVRVRRAGVQILDARIRVGATARTDSRRIWY